MFAVVEAARAGLFSRRHWWPNLIAGLIVGVVALPLAMAFAIASGARPEQGLYTAIVGGALVSLCGGSRLQIAGPTGAFIAILAGITAKYGIAGLQVATLLAGGMLLVMGLTRMGGVIRFIPAPVIAGFTAGIGVIIFVGQWRHFFGLAPTTGEHFHEQLWQLLRSLPATHLPTCALGVASLALVVYTRKTPLLKRIPGPLVALLAATAASRVLDLPGVATIGSTFGGIPTGLPHFAIPDLSVAQILALLGPAFTIAMLGAIESLLAAVVVDGMTGTRHDPNQELVGQGLANIVCPLFGGFAATGAIARTATSIRNGATGPLAGIVHALTLVGVLLFLAPLAADVPLAALAAILFVVAWNMSDLPHFLRIARSAPPADRTILGITFVLTVFADLVVAVNVGVILAILHFLRRMSAAVDTQAVPDEDLKSALAPLERTALPPDVAVYEVSGPMFFGAVEQFERALVHTQAAPQALIVRLRDVPFIDITAIETLEGIAETLHGRGARLILCEANARVRSKLIRAGVIGRKKRVRYAAELRGALALAEGSSARAAAT